tara:strand:+ start:176 stop:508 length:333 start_codon:yes stop_codon:yes gene_type:complete
MTKYIFIGGKERPIRFSYKAFKAITIKLKLKLTEFDKIVDKVENIAVIAFHGLQSGAMSEGLNVDFTKAKVEDWLDEAGFGMVYQILEAFNDSQPQSNDEEKAAENQGNA